jgi:hypothetical protein
MKSNKIHFFTSLLLLTLLVHKQAAAQGIMISSIGSFAGTSSNMSAINFKSSSTCIDVQSGIAVLKGERNDGQFAINCEVKMQFNTLGIKLYPNPVINVTKVKFVNAPPLTETFNLSIWTTEGAMMSTRKETGYNLFQGLTIDLGNLTAGSYVLKIESASFVDAIKFIKAN